jgi:bifunctional enzyme CysN/CysC
MAVQWVNRPNQHFRGYAGRIASGRVRVGDEVVVLPAGRRSTIERIATFDGDLSHAVAGQSVTLTFTDEIDCSRGDVIAAAKVADEPVSRLAATLVWMSDEKLVPHRSYWLKIGTQTLSANVDGLKSVIDVNTLEQNAGDSLGLNDIGRVELQLDRGVPAVRYVENRKLGGFILIDKITHATVAAGLIDDFPANPIKLSRRVDSAENINWVLGNNRTAWAAKALERANALGRRAFVIDEAALSGFETEYPVRTAREIARLMARTGVDVLITIEVNPAEAHPGRITNADDSQDGGDTWVI